MMVMTRRWSQICWRLVASRISTLIWLLITRVTLTIYATEVFRVVWIMEVALGNKLLRAVACRNVVSIKTSILRPRLGMMTAVIVITAWMMATPMVVVYVAPVVVVRRVVWVGPTMWLRSLVVSEIASFVVMVACARRRRRTWSRPFTKGWTWTIVLVAVVVIMISASLWEITKTIFRAISIIWQLAAKSTFTR